MSRRVNGRLDWLVGRMDGGTGVFVKNIRESGMRGRLEALTMVSVRSGGMSAIGGRIIRERGVGLQNVRWVRVVGRRKSGKKMGRRISGEMMGGVEY